MKPYYYSQTFHFEVEDGIEGAWKTTDILTLVVHEGGKFDRSEISLYRSYHDNKPERYVALFNDVPTTLKMITSPSGAAKVYTDLLAQLAGLNNE